MADIEGEVRPNKIATERNPDDRATALACNTLTVFFIWLVELFLCERIDRSPALARLQHGAVQPDAAPGAAAAAAAVQPPVANGGAQPPPIIAADAAQAADVVAIGAAAPAAANAQQPAGNGQLVIDVAPEVNGQNEDNSGENRRNGQVVPPLPGELVESPRPRQGNAPPLLAAPPLQPMDAENPHAEQDARRGGVPAVAVPLAADAHVNFGEWRSIKFAAAAAAGANETSTEYTVDEYTCCSCDDCTAVACSTSCNYWLLKFFNFLDSIGPFFCMVGSAFMQVCLPVFVLIHWVHDEDDMRDEHVTWREVFQDFDASMVEPHPSLEIRFVKGIVATYVLFYVLLKDFKWLYKLLLQAFRLYDAKPKPPIFCRKVIVYIITFCCVVHSAIVALVYMVSLVLITRSPTPKDVLLSGVGALFILEIDDLLVPMSQKEFGVRAKIIAEKNADDLLWCLEGKKVFVFVVMIWSFILFSIALWLAFLVNLNRYNR